MHRLVEHIRGNVISYLALFCALSGTGYAAITIPRSSVGTPQLRNGAVTAAKLNGKQIAGTIYAWAYVDANGKVVASHGLRSGASRGQGGFYGFGLRNQNVPKGCAATASIATTRFESYVPGSAVALLSIVPRPAGVVVATFNAAGQPTQLPFVVQVLC
jgi:hypothetical protein